MKQKFLTYLQITTLFLLSSFSYARTVVAIDAGHGGHDRGTTGLVLKIHEKDVVLPIAKELKKLLDANPNFKTVMLRDSDVFIPLADRPKIARKKKANYFVSIHADSLPSKPSLKGAAVWVLSSTRANQESNKWIEESEKQSQKLGSMPILNTSTNDDYLNKTVLDLQFSYSMQSGYSLGRSVLQSLSKVTHIVKEAPKHESFAVLTSPDISSILVETGYLSNEDDERNLATPAYRKKIARAIYEGIVAYHRNTHVKETNTNAKQKSHKKEKEDKEKKNKDNKKEKKSSSTTGNDEPTKTQDLPTYHIVEKDQTLYSIARMYNTSPQKLAKLNNIKDGKIIVGRKLKLK